MPRAQDAQERLPLLALGFLPRSVLAGSQPSRLEKTLLHVHPQPDVVLRQVGYVLDCLGTDLGRGVVGRAEVVPDTGRQRLAFLEVAHIALVYCEVLDIMF